jgi:hypothetical protein
MKENLDFQKFSPEEIAYFNGLVKKYGLNQDVESLIIPLEDGSRVFITKAVVRNGFIPFEINKGIKNIKLEDHIENLINKKSSAEQAA